MQRSDDDQSDAAGTGRRRPLLAVGAGLTAVSAWGGAAGLMSGVLSLGEEITARLPFASPVLGGVALALVVALPASVLAVAAWRGSPHTDLLSSLLGAALIGWIVVQVAFIRTFSFFQPTYAVVGVLFLVAGRRAWSAPRRRQPADLAAAPG